MTDSALPMLSIPEQGQLVRLRNRFWSVEDVIPHPIEPTLSPTHHVTLECLDDDRLGETLDVIWERELAPAVRQEIGLPAPERWDAADRFQAFLHAVTWSTSSVVEVPAIQSPFRAAIELDGYQLEPVARAILMPRVNLLVSDDG